MTRTIDIVVAGHACLDVTPTFPDGRARDPATLLQPGRLNEVGPVALSTGGAVSNTGLALVRMGLAVELMGKVGDDAFGTIVRDMYAAEGAGAGTRPTPGALTSYTCVIAAPGIDRIFFHCPGCNDTFNADDVDYDLLGQSRMFHFGYPPLMRKMYEDGGDTLADMMRRAEAAGVTTAMDMAYPDPVSDAGRADWRAILGAALPHVHVFTPSLEEILFMLDRERFDALHAGDGGDDAIPPADVRRLGDELVAMGVRAALIKCGSRGLYLRTAPRERWTDAGAAAPDTLDAWADRELWRPSYRVEVVNATGSGDTAIAGFHAGFLKGLSPEEALATGNMAAAMNVRTQDVVSGIQPFDQVLAESRKLEDRLPFDPGDGGGWTWSADDGCWRGPSDAA